VIWQVFLVLQHKWKNHSTITMIRK
jgi:hypothetical protein